jgi:uncharacterized protein
MSNSSSKGTALITGASRGIGAVYADRLAKRGHDLILVARSEEPLKALAASLSSASGRQITPIVADLNNETGLAKVETKLKARPVLVVEQGPKARHPACFNRSQLFIPAS